jgi:hypothetical protein
MSFINPGWIAEFLKKEILAEAGKTLRLTDDPDKRAIRGMISGGIRAFTVAWERRDLSGIVALAVAGVKVLSREPASGKASPRESLAFRNP